MSSRIRVGVLDEQEIVHYGVRAYFAGLPDIAVAGSYFRSSGVLHAIEAGGIDLLLMDYAPKCQDSLDFIRYLNIQYSKLRVLVFLAVPCTATVTMLLDAGVHGIVCKCQPLEDCVQAIRLLASGRHYDCPGMSVAPSVSPPVLTGTADVEAVLLSLPALSLREREVLRLCISGLTVTCIAELFGRSLKTVSTQKQSAYRKLGLRGDMDLFRRLARYEV
ncbi:response regulator transcription factor [Pseudomonas fluorescens]|uniref:response regulator transcription factor n=1 Tax=Pseudomonas fluorescens TaxID=294 RepID=UPI0009378CD3|nr:response regulator transcription factor [Pseudomonas fluorescens]